jgi:protein transport protein SEC61 subunit alpha
MGSKNDRELF